MTKCKYSLLKARGEKFKCVPMLVFFYYLNLIAPILECIDTELPLSYRFTHCPLLRGEANVLITASQFLEFFSLHCLSESRSLICCWFSVPDLLAMQSPSCICA